MALLGSIVVNGKLPILASASVKLFKVVDFPLDGFPTIPINGSRGIFFMHSEEGEKFKGGIKWCEDERH